MTYNYKKHVKLQKKYIYVYNPLKKKRYVKKL